MTKLVVAFRSFPNAPKNVSDKMSLQLSGAGYFHWHYGYYVYIYFYFFIYEPFWTYSLFCVFEIRG